MADLDSADELATVEEKIAECQQLLGYHFSNRDLLQAALTHASGASSRLHSNERMEFLGDSILGLVVCEYLYVAYPEYLEGDLTKIKSVVVSRRVCAKISRQLGLEKCLIVGRGMQGAGGVPRSLLSDVFEAIIAAIYFDAGFDVAKTILLHFLKPEIQLAIEGHSGETTSQPCSNTRSAISETHQLMLWFRNVDPTIARPFRLRPK